MALYEQLHLKAIPPAPLPVMSECFSPEDEEFLLQISVDCELDDVLLTDSIDWHALDVESSTSTSDNRRRKRTYELRKEEINVLDKKTKVLSTQLKDLKRQAGIQDEQSISQQQLNHMFREMLRNQQLLIAAFDPWRLQIRPLSSRIHLESDLAERRKLLQDIKFQKIHNARYFIEKRTEQSPMTSRLSEFTRYRTGDGNTIAVRFDIVPLPEAKSVKQVFDAIMHCFAHLDIYLAEILGNIAEDAIVTTDFIDQDNIFPYSPQARIWKDIASVLHVQSCKRPHETAGFPSQYASSSSGGSAGGYSTSLANGMQQDDIQDACDEQVVVLTMGFQTNMRRCEFQIPEPQMQELARDSDRVHEAVLKCLRVSLRSDQID